MSDQTIHTPDESGGKPIMVGARGGLHTKDGMTTPQPKSKFGNPICTLEGPGFDIGFFQDKNGYIARSKGPNAKLKIKEVQKYLDKGMDIKRAVSEVKTNGNM